MQLAVRGVDGQDAGEGSAVPIGGGVGLVGEALAEHVHLEQVRPVVDAQARGAGKLEEGRGGLHGGVGVGVLRTNHGSLGEEGVTDDLVGDVTQTGADGHGRDLARAVLGAEGVAGSAVVLNAAARVNHGAEVDVAGRAARGDDDRLVGTNVHRLLGLIDVAVGEGAEWGKGSVLTRQDSGRVVSLDTQHATLEHALAVQLVHVVVEQELGAGLASSALQRAGDGNAATVLVRTLLRRREVVGVGDPVLGDLVGVGPTAHGLRLVAALGVVGQVHGLDVLHEHTLVQDVVVGLGHVIGHGAHHVAVAVDGVDALGGGVVLVVLVGGVLDAVLLLDLRAAAGVQVAAGQGATTTAVVVGVNEKDRDALVKGAHAGRKTRTARADDDDVGLVIPLDARGVDGAHDGAAIGDLEIVVDVGERGGGTGGSQRSHTGGAADHGTTGDGVHRWFPFFLYMYDARGMKCRGGAGTAGEAARPSNAKPPSARR